MGMSSSQARLLTLTGRMHDIEYKAARLEAQKLQMANESRRVYEDYLNAIDATALQGMVIGKDGSMSGKNLTLNLIDSTNSEFEKSFYLQEISTGKLLVSPTLAEKYHLDGSGNIGTKSDFMRNAGFEFIYTDFDTVPNTNAVTRYTSVANQVQNAEDKQVPAIPNGCGFKDSTFGSVAVSAPAVSSVASFTAGETYTINNKADLVALATLTNSGVNTAGVNFVLTSDIDMAGETWNGIGTSSNYFKGSFDGNFHKISNLTGTKGLFAFAQGNQATVSDVHNITPATQGVIKNLKLENVNINASSSGAAGLIGKGIQCYVENVYVTGQISAVNWAGGIIGENTKGVIVQSTSTANITATNTCIGGFTGHDTSGVMLNCLAKGNVTQPNASGYVGGFIGHETNSGKGIIEGCAATGVVTSAAGASYKGSFIGVIDGGCSATVNNSQYRQTEGVNSVGQGTYSSSGTDNSLSEGGTQTIHTQRVILPSQQSIASNIRLALELAGQTEPANLENWLSKLYQVDPTLGSAADPVLIEDALKLASINNHICNYIAGGEGSGVVTALIQDINNNTLTMSSATKNYQDYYKVANYEYTPYASNDNSARATHFEDVTTGSVTNIANNIYTAFRRLGHTEINNETLIKEWLESKYPIANEANKVELAEINNNVANWLNGNSSDSSEIQKLYAAYNSNSAYSIDSAKKIYTFPNAVTNVIMTDQTQEGREDYDMTQADVLDALSFYEHAQNGYVLVTEEQASSNVWLTNVVNSGDVTIFEYNKQKHTSFETSVATNTSLQEVPDETLIRKAEAKYEADMKRIDLKDRKYDTDLAALDAERNAIKQEMETLKTVAKENVERTFKLFS